MVKNYELKQKTNEMSNKKKKIANEDSEKLKTHKKADNSYFNKIDLISDNQIMLNNPQIMFKSNLHLEVEKEGDFRYGDIAKKLLFAKKTKNGILFAVEWETRENEVVPDVSFYDNSQLKIFAPQVLIDFYEDRIKSSY